MPINDTLESYQLSSISTTSDGGFPFLVVSSRYSTICSFHTLTLYLEEMKNFLEVQKGTLDGQSEWEGEGKQKGKANLKTLNAGQRQQSHLFVFKTNTLLD
jgi:hypothetical protein